MTPTPEGPAIVMVLPGPRAWIDDLRELLDERTVTVSAPGGDSPRPGDPSPDVVVVDAQVAPALDPALRGIPVLAVVGRGSPDEVSRALDAGALDVLAFPFDGSEVAARVAAAARVARAESRLRARNAELTSWADRAGHDLMTPLAIISGMAETLEGGWDRLAAPDRLRLVGSIRNQAARAMAMLDEAVALARRDPPPPAER